jgi:thiol-disulfide isomerase/thioredoxin
LILDMRLYLLFIFCSGLFHSCNSSSNSEEPVLSEETSWLGYMTVDNDSIPFRFLLNTNELILINGDEKIILTSKQGAGDTFIYSFPQYESSLYFTELSVSNISGYWHYSSRGDYYIPFSAQKSTDWACPSPINTLRYNVLFSPEQPEKSTNAIGIFDVGTDACITGTFLTESGDYRFLQGERNGNNLWLSCFDGAHLFLFKGETKGDSIVSGSFLSGKHWSEKWVGQLNNNGTLKHPDAITTFNDDNNPLKFTVQSLSGDSVEFGLDNYKNKVTIVQIFGSWCPNCYDEMTLYSQLNRQIADSRLQVIPVAFERNDSLPRAFNAINKFMRHTKAPFDVYFGGKANKKNASEVFSQLSPICSFPTSIFIDKKGVVRKIHTGFYGPGTGEHYELYNSELHRFLKSLLAE